MISINEFKSHVNRGGGLAEPNKFRVLISGAVLKSSKARAMAFLVNQASIPGRSLATNEIRTYGPIRKAPYASVYDDFQIMVYCQNNNLFPRDLFEEWQNSIVQTTTGRVNYFDQYVADINLEQYNPEGKTIFACKFVDAYPITVAPIGLDWAATNQTVNLGVTFAYRKWHIDPLPLLPFGNNLAINSLYPNFDLTGVMDNFGMAVMNRTDGSFMSNFNQAGNFLGNMIG